MNRLIAAVRKGSLADVKRRLKAGDSPDAFDDDGMESALALAATWGKLSIVRALLKAGANPGDRRYSGSTPLVVAAAQGHTKIVQLLLDHGADVDEDDSEGGTALIEAAAGGHEDIVDLLLEADANVRHKDRDRKTAIIYAAEKRHESIVEELAPYSTANDVREARFRLKLAKAGPTKEKVRKFHEAARNGDIDSVKAYLDAGGDVNAMNSDDGETAVFPAARGGHLEVIKLLAKHGANLSHMDTASNTALLYAFNERGMPAYKYLRTVIDPKLVAKWDKWLIGAEKRAKERYPEIYKLYRKKFKSR